MKRIISAVLIAAVVLTLASCEKFTCDGCEQEKTGKAHKVKILEDVVVMCDDCYEEFKTLTKGIGE